MLTGQSWGNLARLMHVTPLSLTKFFGFAWLLMGLLWMRRAYIGEKRGVLVTLRPSLAGTMTRRERIGALLMGIAFSIMGVVELIFSRR